MTTEGDIDDKLGPLMDEFLSRKRNGEYPSLSEFVQRHPELESEIRELFPAVAMMEQAEVSEPSRDDAAAVTPDGKELKRLGDFQIIREIGRGGMGVVYEAIQESLGRHVALKLLPWQSVADARQVKRFQREARIAASLHHSNIVPVYGVGEADGLHFLAMQYIHGQSLDSVLRELQQLPADFTLQPAECDELSSANGGGQSRVIATSLLHHSSRAGGSGRAGSSDGKFHGAARDSETQNSHSEVSSASLLRETSGRSTKLGYFRRAAELIAQVADALEYAHSQGVLHRDIKPANLMLDVAGDIWITDFGLARGGDTEQSTDSDGSEEVENLTQTGDLIGTLRYLAPERFLGENDFRSEVYSLGLTLFEFLTLQPAFRAADKVTLIRLITTSPPPLPRTIVPEVPRDLETIVVKAAHPDPRLRYQSAAAMAKDLRRFLDDKPIVARRASPWKRFQLWCRRNPSVAALSGLALSLLVLVSIISSVAAVKLSSRQNDLLLSLDRATNAELRERKASAQATRNLFEAYAARAKSGREGFRPGRGFDGLKAIANASSLRDRLEIDDKQVMNLRNEAIACMGLVDVRLDVDRPDPGVHCSFQHWGFDSRARHYARVAESTRIEILSVDDGSCVRRISNGWDTRYKPCTRFSPDDHYLAVFGHHKAGGVQLEIWDLESGTLHLPAVPSTAEWHAHSIAFSDDSQLAAWIGNDQVVVYDLSKRRVLKARPLGYAPDFITFCQSGCHLAMEWGSAVALFEWNSDRDLTVIDHPHAVRDADFSRSGRYLATACFDHRAYVWDLQNPSDPISVCEGHHSKVLRAEFSPDDRILMTTAWDDTTRLWNPLSGSQLVRINRYATGFSMDGEWLGLQETGGFVGRWKIGGTRACQALSWKTDQSGVRSIAFHPAGHLLAHTAGNSVVVRDWPSGCVLHELILPAVTTEVEFSPDGTFLFAGSEKQLARWNSETLAHSETSEIERTRVEVPAIGEVSPGFALVGDGTRGFVNFGAGQAHAMTVDDAHIILGAKLPSSHEERFVSTPSDGSMYALAGKGTNVVRVFRSSDNAEVFRHEFSGNKDANVIFDPTGRYLCLAARRQFLLFETETWAQEKVFESRSSGFGRAAFSPDGTMLAMHDGENVVLVRTEGFATLARFQNPGGESYSKAGPEAILALAFSPDQRYLATGTGGDDGLLYVWDLHDVRRQLAVMDLDWNSTPIPDEPPRTVSPSDHRTKCFCHLPVSQSDVLTLERRQAEESGPDDPENTDVLAQ